MKSTLGEFITGPTFGALASKAVAAAVAEANEKGLPKAYSDRPADVVPTVERAETKKKVSHA